MPKERQAVAQLYSEKVRTASLRQRKMGRTCLAHMVWVAPHEHHERPHEEGHAPIVTPTEPLERQLALDDLHEGPGFEPLPLRSRYRVSEELCCAGKTVLVSRGRSSMVCFRTWQRVRRQERGKRTLHRASSTICITILDQPQLWLTVSAKPSPL